MAQSVPPIAELTRRPVSVGLSVYSARCSPAHSAKRIAQSVSPIDQLTNRPIAPTPPPAASCPPSPSLESVASIESLSPRTGDSKDWVGSTDSASLPTASCPLPPASCLLLSSVPIVRRGYAWVALYILESVPVGGWRRLQKGLYSPYLVVESLHHGDCCLALSRLHRLSQ